MKENESELIELAENYIQQEKYPEATVLLNQILSEINQDSIIALNDLAVIQILENKFQNALEYLNKVLLLEPLNELAINNLTYLKQKLDEIKLQPSHKIEIENNLSVIIPVYNKVQLTINCLRSLNQLNTGIKFEVIIVDNASTDETQTEIDKLKNELNYELKYVLNETNLGFAKANNIGAKYATYETLLLLNNDTLVKEDFITKPLSYLKNNKVGVVGIKLLYPDNLVQHSGIVFNHLKRPEHILKFYNSNHPFVNRVYEMQAVTGACMFIRKKDFESVGGFDESYVNGWEDMDLCFKIASMGLKILYTGEAAIYHLESQSDGRLNFAKENEKLFNGKWGNQIKCDEDLFYKKVKEYNSQFSFKKKFYLPNSINFAIKIGVPNREEKGWGDIYYANSLAKSLRELGHKIVIHYLNEWDQSDENIDVVVHIKGLTNYKLKDQNINVIWIINHPELHTIDELNQYDLVLCASKKYYELVATKLSKPCFYLPQATDELVFQGKYNSKEKDIDLLFVGNNYEYKNNKCRSIIEDIVKSGRQYNIHIIGKYWDGFVPENYIKSEFVNWDELPTLYGRAKIVLNDHQETMRENGFINNRTFDLALMKAFQINNYVEGLSELDIVTYNDSLDLINKIDFYLTNDERRIENTLKVYEKCKSFTFSQLAIEIINTLNKITSEKSTYTQCNICGYKGDDFLDMGSRKKVRCPICNSLERQRALWFLLNRDNMIRPNMKVLEIAPLNNKIYRKYFEEAGCEYICVDKWKHGNPLDPRDTSWIDYEMDVCDLKFDDKTFDLVLMQHVIEEVPDDYKAFSEIARVTKQDGFAVLEVPHNKNLRKTIEYNEPQKFGNLRQYGVDFYEKISSLFVYREEVIIDNVLFSRLGKVNRPLNLNLPILLDHPAFSKESFTNRFSAAANHLLGTGFTSLTTAQVNNLVHRNVFYKHPVWFTFDDGSVEDIEQAYPILKKSNISATSFLIPEHLNEKSIDIWKKVAGNPNLDIQNHSKNHLQCFVSSKIIGVQTGIELYPNLMEDTKEIGTPIFEYTSCLKSKRFIPHKKVLAEAINFYKQNTAIDSDNYIYELTEFLVKKFNNDLGELESEATYLKRLNDQIEESREKLIALFGGDVYAFSYPWGLYSNEALNVSSLNHSISVGVNPKRINHKYESEAFERIEITGSAYSELLKSIYSTQPWEKYDYRNLPVVSALMTTFSRQDLVAESIQSVIDQTYKNWELIIVNDGGEDIEEIVKQFNDPRIKYFNCKHKGKAASLNFAIQNSQSKYIAYLDDDDKYYPNHLEVLINYLENHSDREFVYSISREVEKVFSQSGWQTKQSFIRYAHQVTPNMLRFMNHIPNLCVVHTRKLFEFTGLYDESLDVLIDWDMYRRLAIYSTPSFLNVVTSEYSKRTFTTSQEKQITGLFFRDPVKYYENRLQILNKKYPLKDNFISNKNCAVIICNDKNINSLRYLIYKIDMIKKDFGFDIVLICDLKLNESIVELIIAAEGRNILAMKVENFNQSDLFIQNVLDNNAWKNIAIVDEVGEFNFNNLYEAFNSNERISNYSKYLKKSYPRKKNIIKDQVEELTVSIIIPTFNNWQYTQNCLKSIFNSKQNKTKYEVIVIDNASKDETRTQLKNLTKKHSNLKVILNDRNYGFAVANNIAAKNSNSDYLLFLNNDTIVSKNWLDKMVDASIKNDAGIVGAKLIYPGNTIQHAGVVIREYQDNIFAYHPFNKEKSDYVLANVYREYQAVTGACLLIKRNLFIEVGMFDENYLNGYEDVDLCFKVREQNQKVIYCPDVNIIHHESKTDGRFDNVSANSKLLNDKWKGKIKTDDLKKLFMPKVSIVIPVHNQLDYTKKCIESIRKYTNIPYEVIVVNDASTDQTNNYLSAQTDIIVKNNEYQKGYPASCNVGIRSSSGQYIVLLNNDTVLTCDWIKHLLEVFEYNKNVGMVGPVSNSISGFQLDKDAKYSSIDAMHQYSILVNEQRKFSWMLAPRIAFVCAVIKREVINKIGGLDERFSPGNFEDDDFCLRAQLAGFKTVIANDVFIHHYGSKSFKADGEKKYNDRLKTNLKIFVDKWNADPDEIWLKGKSFNQKRSLFISVDKDEFVKSFERAKKNIEDKEFNLALTELQKACSEFENSDKAISIISKEDLLLFTANISLIINDLEKAKQYFEEALKLNPSSSDACFGLGQVFYQAEMFEQSKTMFEWAVKNNSQNQKAIDALKLVNQNLSLPVNHNSLFENEMIPVESES